MYVRLVCLLPFPLFPYYSTPFPKDANPEDLFSSEIYYLTFTPGMTIATMIEYVRQATGIPSSPSGYIDSLTKILAILLMVRSGHMSKTDRSLVAKRAKKPQEVLSSPEPTAEC